MSDNSEQTTRGQLSVSGSLIKRARNGDQEAMGMIFAQFLAQDEEIYAVEYLGTHGLWGMGTRCFACLTNRRISSLRVGSFGEVVYQDGFLEHINSGVIHQPSMLMLYIKLVVGTIIAIVVSIAMGGSVSDAVGGSTLIFILTSVVTLSLSLFIFWFIAIRLYYALNKCGLVWWIRNGVSVYTFANRKYLVKANNLYRLCTELRDSRLKAVREPL